MSTLSVVIPAYNEEQELPDLLRSISMQTLKPVEVIVADAHSTDGTREVAASFGARVVDGGLPSVGRNRGGEVATGEWMVFLDADAKLPHEKFFEEGIEEMRRRDLAIACPDVTATCDWRAKLYFKIYTWYTHLLVRAHPHVIGVCIFVKRSLHESIGGFDESIRYAEDHEYGLRASKVGKFGYLHQIVKTPPRRFERDGYIRSAITYIRSAVYVLTRGPIRDDRFRYGFGYEKRK